jgi:hypothetical protein
MYVIQMSALLGLTEILLFPSSHHNDITITTIVVCMIYVEVLHTSRK